MYRLRSAALRNQVLLAIAAVLFIAAGVSYFSLSRQDAAPTDQFVGLYCPKCNHFFRVSYRDFETLWNKREFQRVEGERDVLFKCEKCGQFTACRADRPPAGADSSGGG